MPLHAVHGETPAQGAAAADLDGIAQRGLARGLADQAPIDALLALAQHLDHAAGAVDRWPLLIAGDQEGDRAAVLRIAAHKFLAGGHHGRQPALHVGRAAAVQERRPGSPAQRDRDRHSSSGPRAARRRYGRQNKTPEPPLPRLAQKLSTGPKRRFSTANPMAARRSVIRAWQPPSAGTDRWRAQSAPPSISRYRTSRCRARHQKRSTGGLAPQIVPQAVRRRAPRRR